MGSTSHPASLNNGGDHARQALCPFPGGTAPVITESLGLLRSVASRRGVAAELTNDIAAVEAQLFNLPVAYAQIIAGAGLVSLGLGQLLASHTLLHFGKAGGAGAGFSALP